MIKKIYPLLILVLSLSLTACKKEAKEVTVNTGALSLFSPLPDSFESPNNPLTEEKINLGRKLYYENRISKNQDVSCNSCHDLPSYGVDNKKTSEGHRRQVGDRNSPTVYNAAGHIAQFWDGRAVTVEEQAKGPILNPVEMAMPDANYVIKVLRSIPGYEEEFQKVFSKEAEPVVIDSVAKAIAAFERKLTTPARWDRFLAGDERALTDEEKAGFNKFVETGCTTCHNGALVGGGMFQKLGLVKPWPDQHDLGRHKVTGLESDKMVFKVPSLRNVEKTAPYFHDGSIGALEEAVKKMGEHQLGKQLSREDVHSIIAWLKSLTGEIPTAYIAKPELPVSGPQTPAPVAD